MCKEHVGLYICNFAYLGVYFSISIAETKARVVAEFLEENYVFIYFKSDVR
jgi:hypothetical protein